MTGGPVGQAGRPWEGSIGPVIASRSRVWLDFRGPAGAWAVQNRPRAARGRVPATVVPVIEVLKHGDFVPQQPHRDGPGRLTLIDQILHDVGLPEDDLARFLSALSSETVFVPGTVVPGPARRGATWRRFSARPQARRATTHVCWSCACSDSTSSAGSASRADPVTRARSVGEKATAARRHSHASTPRGGRPPLAGLN